MCTFGLSGCRVKLWRNTNTAEMEGGGKPRTSVAPKEGGFEGTAKGGPQRVGPLLPGFRVWV